ncbi:geranylgeranylglyceryl/heptaprenylglyceryl phosphate synthase [uncultured Nonlabens sp.]|uniref:geranylgeranylglyceryl/heptaprenylglyceryl phosphate synthase n=1 Tax=uncultured Nonlabens sp. TaxID=859306 RepID=UPI00261B4194|nr:geranylgeranylglyceryl/heptaprenylglyceryl phosphate synthase [uncultured Nonlabens sp.]
MPDILKTIEQSNRSLSILIDPEKMEIDAIPAFAKAIIFTIHNLKGKLQIDQFYFFVGGSTMENVNFDKWVKELRENCNIPIVIFPGSHHQLSENADGLLFLNLISGRNSDFLIEQQVHAANKLKKTKLEVVPTGYILIDGGKETAVQRISQTLPLPQRDMDSIVNHAYAAQLMGNRLVYLEAGSGALKSVSTEIVREVTQQIDIPLIVGGGLQTIKDIQCIYDAGAQMAVVGTAIEKNIKWNG